MSLRVKTLLSGIIGLIGLIAISFVTLQMILSSGFARMDEHEAHEDIEWALDALSAYSTQLESATGNWARWDATYNFVENVNADYIKANLTDSTFTDLNLNLMVFIDVSGRIVFSKGYDLQNRKEMSAPSNLQEHLAPGSYFLNHPDIKNARTGILSLSEGLLLVSAMPIPNSQEEGPIRGTLIFGRFLDAAEITRLAQTSQLTLAIHRWDDPHLPADFQTARAVLSDQASVIVRPLSDQTNMGYALVKDIYGKPALILSTATPRHIYQQGQADIVYVMWAMLAIGVAFCAVAWVVVDRFILARLTHLSQGVRRISANGAPARRVSAHGADEISSLASEINRMLDAIQQSQQALCESEERYRLLSEATHDMIFIINRDLTVQYVNSFAADFLFRPPETIIGKPHAELFPREIAEQQERSLRQVLSDGVARYFESNSKISSREIWLSTWLVPIRNGGGEPSAIIGVSRDITERKHAEEALRESEELYRDLVEHSHALICTHDLQGHFLSANQWAVQLLGYENIPVLQMNLRDLLAPEARDQADEYLARIQRDGVAHGLMLVQTRAGEKRIWEYHNTLRTEGVAEPIVRGIAHDITDQKRLERALRESEERWRTYIEQANDLIFALDASGRCTLANRALCSTLGYAAEELVGKSPLEFVAPAARASTQTMLSRVLRGENVEQVEFEVLTRGQRRILLEVRGRTFLQSGKIAGTFHIARDITERKHAEEALRRSQKEWQDIFNAINHPAFILDSQHEISAANPAVLKQLGKPEAEVIGRKCYQLFHNAACSPLGCPMEAMLRSGKTETVEMEMRAAGGTYLVSCTPVLDERGNLEKVIHIATDIAARKRAEDELAQSHSLLKAAFDSTADGLLVVDGEGKITQSNRKFAEMWRIPPEILAAGEDDQALAFVLEQLSEPDDFARKVRELYAQPDAESFDVLRFKDGRMFERYSQPQYLDKQIIGRVWSFRNVTERQHAEAVLREYSERLEQMVEARTRELRAAQEQLIRQERLAVLGQLAGGVAHELRSPLSAIKNAAYYFKMVVENPSSDAREMMDILDQQIDVSARIIGSLLDFARPKTPTLQQAQLARVIDAAICQCNIPKNITVVWHTDESLPSIKVDVEQMQLVYSNLITNAVQAMPQGGQLTIAIQPAEDKLHAAFSDTGVGIPAEALDKVFQPLYTTKAKGIGLGLALSRIIVEAHGGTIGVTSQVGQGTRFTISLPIDP